MDLRSFGTYLPVPPPRDYSEDIECVINQQINYELYGSHLYLSLSFYFDRHNMALGNISKWFKNQSEEEHCQAITLMKYQNTRGGRIVLEPIQKPQRDEWSSALEAYQTAFSLERGNNQSLLNLRGLADRSCDSSTCDFLEDHFLQQQVNLLEQIAKIIMSVRPKIFRICEFLDEDDFKHNQMGAIEQASKFIAHLERVGKGLGEFMFDEELDTNIHCICGEEEKKEG